MYGKNLDFNFAILEYIDSFHAIGARIIRARARGAGAIGARLIGAGNNRSQKQ